MDRVFSELLPQDKMTHVEALIKEGKRVLFVGDGINDAPVLARADLGVAMGDWDQTLPLKRGYGTDDR